MPYNSVEELPANIRKLPLKKQRQWMHIWNSAYARCMAKHLRTDCEAFAFANANGVVLAGSKLLGASPEFRERVLDILNKFTPSESFKELKAELAKNDPYKYTIDSLMNHILLVEDHCQRYLEGKDPELCSGCIKNKHLPTIRALSLEGTSLTQNKYKKDKFIDIAKKIDKCIEMLSTINKENIQNLQDTIRTIRKDIERNMMIVTVLSDEALLNGWIPEKGVSGLDKSLEEKIPKNLQYWIIDDRATRIETRNKLVESINTGSIALDLSDHVFPIDVPREKIDIREEEKEDTLRPQSIWRCHQAADRLELEGTLLSFGAWNGYYYPAEVIDSVNAKQLINLPIRYEHTERDIGKIVEATNTRDHSITIKAWVEDPKVIALIREKKCTGLSPKLIFTADENRKTVKLIKEFIEASIVENPACKVCFIEHIS